MTEIDSASSLNAVSRDKKSASVRQAEVPTNFNLILPQQKNLQFYDKKSASVRQPSDIKKVFKIVIVSLRA